MKKIALILIPVLLAACTSAKENLTISDQEKEFLNSKDQQEVTIADEETEYEIIIIEPGFYAWLNSIARPEGYYSQNFLENRNQIYVMNWNQRVLNPTTFNPNLYELQINYDPNIDYGYEVNYKLYNYFIFFSVSITKDLAPFFHAYNA